MTVKVDGRLRIKLPLSRLSPASYAGPSLKTVNRFRFGFAANTGRVTDNHEIWNIRAAYAPTLQVTTTTTPRTFSRLHQILRYRFVVTNIGGDAVSNIRLRHGAFRLRGLTCAATSLVPGAAHRVHRHASRTAGAGAAPAWSRTRCGPAASAPPAATTPRRARVTWFASRAADALTSTRWVAYRPPIWCAHLSPCRYSRLLGRRSIWL